MLFERLGGLCQGIKNGGSRTSLEQNSHIYFFKWKATKFAIITFRPMDPVVQSIHLQMENINALVYLVKMGAEGGFYPPQSSNGYQQRNFRQLIDQRD